MKRREFITLLGGRGGVAARGTCAAGVDAGDWFSQQPIADGLSEPSARISPGAERNRLSSKAKT